MSKHLDPINFNLLEFRKGLTAFGSLLSSSKDLEERKTILPLFNEHRHLSSFIGSFAYHIGPATELAFKLSIFGDFRADLVLGSKLKGEFIVVEFEEAKEDSIFKKAKSKATLEWGRKFNEGYNQIVDWFYSLEDHKPTDKFEQIFGRKHAKFSGLLVIGRDHYLDASLRKRLLWRSDKLSVNSNKISCITYDEFYSILKDRDDFYSRARNFE